jgi:hypothetical protein
LLSKLEGLLTSEEGALTPLFCAAHPTMRERQAEYTAAFVVPFGDPGTEYEPENARRDDLRESIWRISEEFCQPYLKEKFEDTA